jgi:hypothetical protein
MGGAGLAAPALIWSLMSLTISFAMGVFRLLEIVTAAFRRYY